MHHQVRDSMLLYYEVTKETRAIWERMCFERAATPGGWCSTEGASGDWTVRGEREAWQQGGPL